MKEVDPNTFPYGQAAFTKEIPEEIITSAMDKVEYEYEVLKGAEDYRAGCLETSSLAEIRERLGHN